MLDIFHAIALPSANVCRSFPWLILVISRPCWQSNHMKSWVKHQHPMSSTSMKYQDCIKTSQMIVHWQWNCAAINLGILECVNHSFKCVCLWIFPEHSQPDRKFINQAKDFSLSHTVTPSNCIGSYQCSCSNHNIKSRPPRNGTRQTNNRLINPIAKWPPPTMDHRCPSPGSRCFTQNTKKRNDQRKSTEAFDG